MSFLSINCDKQFLYVIIYWIFEITFVLLKHFIEPYFIIIKNDKAKNEYMLVLLSNLGDLLSGFLILYTNHASKSIRENVSKEKLVYNNPIKLNFYEEAEPDLKQNFYKKMLIISIVNYISRSLYWISYAFYSLSVYEPEKIATFLGQDMLITIDIIIRYVISIFILKSVIYRHSIFSIIMIDSGVIILLLSDFLLVRYSPVNKKMGATMLYSGILLIRAFTTPYEHMLIKQLFDENHILPASIQFIRGLISTLILLVMTPIFLVSFCLNSKINFENSLGLIVTMIFYILKDFITSYVRLKIIYHFSIQSISFLYISVSLGGSIVKVYDYINAKNKTGIYFFLVFLEIFGNLIILFSTLVYDEVIIINKCGLHENVKLEIIERGERDTIRTINNLDNDSLLDIKNE